MLGEGDSSELLQSIRAHGNLMEHAPIALILFLLLEMHGVAAVSYTHLTLPTILLV